MTQLAVLINLTPCRLYADFRSSAESMQLADACHASRTTEQTYVFSVF
jgi:hypothetical protein